MEEELADFLASPMANTNATRGELVKAIGDLAKTIRKQGEKIQALESQLEQQPFGYDGPHEAGKTYKRGVFVTHAGSLWHCNYTTASRPGDGPGWTLAVKRGQDGKDLR